MSGHQLEVEAPPTPGVRPAKLIGLKRKTKRQGCALQPLDINEIIGQNRSLLNVARKEPFNPFRKNESSKSINSVITAEDDAYQIVERRLSGKANSLLTPSLVDECANFAVQRKDEKKDNLTCKTLPLDWSLKTRIRFASPKPFPWRGCLKTCEEASGTTSFVRCLNSSGADEATVDSSDNAKFHQQCLTWTHPSLPWLKLFPRMEQQFEKSKPSLFMNDKEMQENLHDDWSESLRSCHQLLRAQQCPFFYLCAPIFTVLFRAAGVGGFSDIHAFITPTTSGLRQSLKDEGINVSMPLRISKDTLDENKVVPQFLVGAPGDQKFDKNCEDGLEDNEEPELLLQSLGLSQDDFPSMNPTKRRKTEMSRAEDGGPKSLVLVQGKDIQALFNFLLSSRHCTSTTGLLAGVPPTLMAPCAFHGATLRSLKVSQGWVKHQGQDMHCIELNGAIMPNQLQGLCSLFGSTQEGHFEAVAATHQPTIAYGLVSSPSNTFAHPAFATANLKDSGLPATLLSEMCKTSTDEYGVLSEIAMKDYLYSFKFI